MYTRYADWKRTDDKKREAAQRYEAYIAKTLREQGWQVTETGLTDGVNDHGIDLIATKWGVTRYIQCKAYNKHRLIHENVVSHLYGSVAAIEGPENLFGVEMYIYSPAGLDDYANQEAIKLHITLARVRPPGR